MDSPNSTFSALDTVSQAWMRVKGVKWVFFKINILYLILLIPGIFMQHLLKTTSGLVFVVMLLAYIGYRFFIALFIMGMEYLGVMRAGDQPIAASNISYVFNTNLVIKILGLFVLMGIIVILVVIPMAVIDGIIFAMLTAASATKTIKILLFAFTYLVTMAAIIYLFIRMYIAALIVIMENMNPWAAIKKSFRLTSGKFWKLFGLMMLNLLLVMISVIPLGIGLIWSIPYIYINHGVVYRKLISMDPSRDR